MKNKDIKYKYITVSIIAFTLIIVGTLSTNSYSRVLTAEEANRFTGGSCQYCITHMVQELVMTFL